MTSQVIQNAVKAHKDLLVSNQEQFLRFTPLLRLLAEGKPVSPEEVATASHRSLEEIQAHLSGIEVDPEGNIVGWGLTLQPTPHQLHLGKQTLYTWCALDALLFPAFLGRAARVISTCPVTGKEIRLTMTPEAILNLEPASAVVSVRLPGEDTDFDNLQEDICNDGFFFVSRDVASTWPSLHPKAVVLDVSEAAQLAREFASDMRSLAGEQKPERHDSYSI